MVISPVSYVKTLEGKSNAHLITFSDGNQYAVKFFQNGFEKVLANEWVAYCLARYLGLPIPYGCIVDIPEEFIANVPELSPLGETVRYQFASRFIPECMDGHQIGDLHGITNSDILPRIILFDYWMANKDRTKKNILFQNDGAFWRLWVIDHAEILGSYNWIESDLDSLPYGIMKSATHQLMAQFILNEEDFFNEIEMIHRIPIFLIEEIVSMIPDEWDVSKEERKAIVNTLLMRRKKILPDLLGKFIKKVYRPLHEEEVEDEDLDEVEDGDSSQTHE